MRICIVTSYDLSRDGGVNRHVLGLRDALQRGGDQVAVLGPASGPVPDGCHGLPGVVGVPINGSVAHIGVFGRQRTTLSYLQTGHFDVVHLHEPIVPGPARHAARLSALPLVATFHTFAQTESALFRRARQAASRPLIRIRQGIAVSAAAHRYAQVIYPGPLAIIPNGITGRDFVAGTEPGAPAAGAPRRILFAGRFGERRKGLRCLLLAAAALARQGHRPQFVVVGDGPKDRFARLAKAADVIFTGRLSDAELAQHYRHAAVFCAPSIDGESFGIVLIEAMAAGCPVVASDIAGYKEAAAGAAVLVPPGRSDDLAAALWRVVNDASLQKTLRAAGRKRAAALDWRIVAPQVRQIYEQALAKPTRRKVLAQR